MASAESGALSGAIARRFGRRARDYERHAHLQREAAETLFAFAAPEGALPGSGPVVEIGCGTGLFTSLASAPGARGDRPYLATDIAPEMVAACRSRFAGWPGMAFAVLDGQEAAFAEPPGLVVSNLTFQWFADPVAGILRLAGQARSLAFSVLVAGSFPQWHGAFADLGRASGLIPLPDENALLAALAALPHLGGLPGARLRHQVLEHTRHYESAAAFVHSFRGIGADHPRPGYRPAPIRPVLKRFAHGMDATARVLYCVLEHHKEAGG